MRRILAGVALVLVAITGCSTGNSQPTATVTKTQTVQPQTQAPVTKNQRFVKLIRDETHVNPGISDHYILKTAHGFCRLLDGGMTPREILNQIVLNSTSSQEAHDSAYFFGASVAAFCPRYRGQITNLGGANV